MKTRFARMILLAAAVGACDSGTTMGWSKQDATPQDFARTRTQCHIQSIEASYGLGDRLSGLVDIGRDGRFRSCMGANGWTLTSQPAGPSSSW